MGVEAVPGEIRFCATGSVCPPLAPRNRPVVVVRHYTLNITRSVLWHGCEPFGPAAVVNGSSPGPTLRAHAGEILQVRVYNELADQNLTMHFHGLAMQQHPVMDGTTLVSQWPIVPGAFFDYRIPLTAEDKGTYFYHSHLGLQAMTAYGPLIVQDPLDPSRDPAPLAHRAEQHPGAVESTHAHADEGLDSSSGHNGPYTWDEDRVLSLGDFWGYSSVEKLGAQLDADPFVWPGSPTQLLVNGQSGPSTSASCNATKAALVGLDCATAPPHCQAGGGWPSIEVEYGKTYRLRIVGSQGLMYLSLAMLRPASQAYGTERVEVERQNMTLIEADGSYLSAMEVDRVELMPGQRYSVLYTARACDEVQNDGSEGVHWMRIESRWRAGPSMWVKFTYPCAKPMVHAPAIELQDRRLLPNETFGWISADLAPVDTRGGKRWWGGEVMPTDEEVTRTVVIDTQQAKFYASRRGVRWQENGELVDDDQPATLVPYLVRTMLGDLRLPTSRDFDAALSSTSYETVLGQRALVANTSDEMTAAGKHRWGQAYDGWLNMYFARADEVIDIVLVNHASELSSNVEIHPWHMHSHKHWTRTIQPGSFSFQRLSSLYSSSDAGFQSPIQRDTTIVYPSPGTGFFNQTIPSDKDGGFAVLRYKVDATNPGFFLLHCHLHFHLAMGMATVWSINPTALAPLPHPLPQNIQGLSSAYLSPNTSVPALI